jgi:S1-C subfamily serine protease
MSCHKSILALILLILGGAPATAAAPDAASRDAIFLIMGLPQDFQSMPAEKVSVMTGTGFLIAPGIIATNNHVVADSAIFAVFAARSTDPTPGTVIWTDAGADFALLRVPGLSGKPLSIATTSLAEAEKVFAIGYPGASIGMQVPTNGFTRTITTGILSSRFTGNWGHSKVKAEVLQHTAEVSPGNSGGPLFDDCNRVIGVNTLISDTSKTSARLSFASSIGELLRRIATISPAISPTLADGSCVDGKIVGGTAQVVPADADNATDNAADNAADDAVDDANAADNAEAADTEEEPEETDGLVAAFTAQPMGIKLASAGIALSVMGLGIGALLRKTKGKPGPKQPEEDRGAEADSGKTGSETPPILRFLITSDDGRLHFALAPELLGERQGISIGRSGDFVDHVIPDQAVSRRHCRFTWRNGDIYVEDLNSAAGTWLNGSPLDPFKPRRVASGMELRLGSLPFSIRNAR